MTLEDIGDASITEMSDEQLIEYIRQVRHERRAQSAAAPRKGRKAGTKNPAKNVVQQLTPEQALAALEALGVSLDDVDNTEEVGCDG